MTITRKSDVLSSKEGRDRVRVELSTITERMDAKNRIKSTMYNKTLRALGAFKTV